MESTSATEWGDVVPGNSVLGDLIGDAEDAEALKDAEHLEAEDLHDAEGSDIAEDEQASVTRAGIPLRGLEQQQQQQQQDMSDGELDGDGDSELRPHIFFE